MNNLKILYVCLCAIFLLFHTGLAHGQDSQESSEKRSGNKVAVIMGSADNVSNIRDAILTFFSDFKVKFAKNGRELDLVLAAEFLDSGPVSVLKIIDHGHPGWLENLDPEEIPFGAFLWMAQGAIIEVYACNYGHSTEFIRQNLALPLLGFNGGRLISYKGWVFPFSVVMPTKDDNPNNLYLNICDICEVPRPTTPSLTKYCSVVDEISPKDEKIIRKYSKMLFDKPELSTSEINSVDFFLDIRLPK
jgi:hypothetical protein